MKGIVLKQWEVQAIQDGRKIRLTRPVKFKYGNTHHKMRTDKYGTRLIEIQNDVEGETFGKNKDGTTWQKLLGYIERKPQYKVGDILFVKETWAEIKDFVNYADFEIGEELKFLFKCDDNGIEHAFIDVGVKKWHPSIHMTIDAARTFLKITGVRVERLGDLSIQDMINEGLNTEGIITSSGPIEYRVINRFEELWNSTIKKTDIDKYSLDANPWVWVIEFERISKEEAYAEGN